MQDNLSIVISADVKPLEQGMVRAEQVISRFEGETKKVTRSTNQASQSIFNLGRIAQDAPFGFIGIQNNIEPLIQSLQGLRGESGSAGAALKALGASLLGPTGVLLGFSLVSSAITVAIQKYGSLGAAIDALFGKQAELSQEITAAAKSYEEFNKQARDSADIKREEATQTEGLVSRVNILSQIVTNNTKSYQERNNALEQLKSISKDYFGNLDLEKLKVADVTNAVNGYTQSIVNAAMARGFEDAISKTNVQLFEQRKLLDKLNGSLQQANADYKIVGIAATRDTRDIIAAQGAYKKQEAVVKSLTDQLGGYRSELDKIINTQVSAKPAVQGLTQQLAKTSGKVTAKTAAVFIPVRPDPAGLGVSTEQADRDINNAFKLANPVVSVPIVPTIPAAAIATFDAFAAKSKAAFSAEQLQGFASTLNSIITPAVNAVFGALESGQNIFQALGQSLKKLIVQLAATVAKAAILAAVLTLITGGASAGAVGFGTLFKGFLGGGGGMGSMFPALGRSAAPSFNGGGIAPGGFQMAGQVVFVQRGSDLVGVLNNTNNRIGRVG